MFKYSYDTIFYSILQVVATLTVQLNGLLDALGRYNKEI